MYNNIGKKIKLAAKIIGGLGIFTSVIWGLILISQAFGYWGEPIFIFMGLMVMAVGGFFSWAGTWLLYGFGELIENVAVIAENTKKEEVL